MRVLALLLMATIAASACGESKKEAPPPPDLSRQQLKGATLVQGAVGEGWKAKENPGPNTVQIGGRIGAANIRPVQVEATSAFNQEEGTGFVSDTILLLRSEEMARAVIPAHEEAALKASWTQDREDGGLAKFSFNGAVEDLTPLGDAMFAARLKVVVTTTDDQTSEHSIEYVAFTLGPLVAFVVTQDVRAGPLARRLESRVAKLLTE